MDRIENRCLDELRALLLKANDLYTDCTTTVVDSEKSGNSDAIKLLDTIADLENKIRIEEYKEDLLNGEV